MAGWDPAGVTSANLGLRREGDEELVRVDGVERSARVELLVKFKQFLRTFADDHGVFTYREQLLANYQQGEATITVDMHDLRAFDSKLLTELREDPGELLPVFEEAAQQVVRRLMVPQPATIDPIQIQLRRFERFTRIRELSAQDVSKLVSVRGMVVSAAKTRVKATQLTIMCRNCRSTKTISTGAGFGSTRLPRRCDQPQVPGADKCPLDPYRILTDSSLYIDQQRLKLQENPEEVPTGEMPRSISLSLERFLVSKVKPGTRVTVIGVYTTYSAHRGEKTGTTDQGIRIPYVRAVGIEPESEATEVLVGRLDPEEEQELLKMKEAPDLYQKIANSIAPALLGHEDIKKAIAAQLFGGSPKHLPDGMRLRGDVNILLLGDPSVGKSQFLKYAHQLAPIGVYTSGKGASAAGLTASVIRDTSSGDFHLEGGALVLADGGLVCIDEFDKMDAQDRVAIHEAMEQQTISIAKAGITTILNSRTSVLAAANPTFSRYDDQKTPTENIDFQSTILSRFDLLFIVRDIQDEKRDREIARHVIAVHKNPRRAVQDHLPNAAGLFTLENLRKYIAYCRAKCTPRLSSEAVDTLKNSWVQFRSLAREQKKQGAQFIPITVRQLEAIVRLSEALAKMELSEVADRRHVNEAVRLFKVSTYQAAASELGDVMVGTPAFQEKVKRCERFLQDRVPRGSTTNTEKLRKDAIGKGFNDVAVLRAIDNLVQKQIFKQHRQRKLLEHL